MDLPGLALFEEYKKDAAILGTDELRKRYRNIFEIAVSNPSNHLVIKHGEILYRARINNASGFQRVSELGMNRINAAANRASRKGDPMMYLADSPLTAAAEIRAQVNQRITVASWIVVRDLNVLCFDNRVSYGSSFNSPISWNTVVEFILILGHEYAHPVNRKDAEQEYVATQTFTEFCRDKGFDGIRYVSSAVGMKSYNEQNELAYNTVLFDDKDVIYKDAFSYRVKKIEYEIDEKAEVLLT